MKDSLELDKKSFLKKFTNIVENVHREIDKYTENPSDENIHDIRVSIRRLESAYSILPRNIREQEKIKDYVKKAKSLFKMNAKIRDYDIICAAMESRYPDKTKELVSSLKNSREKQLEDATRYTLKISKLDFPKIIKSDLKKSKLKKRYLKVLDEITLNIQRNIIVVLASEKMIDELHTLRKDFKKLRYSLELATNKKITLDILKNLKNIQDMLGEIHDNDIIIDYLRNFAQSSTYSGIIESEVLERSKEYNTFVSTMKKSKDISFAL